MSTSTSTTHSGSCVCGQVKWTIQGEPLAMAVCHCFPCRKTASASASNNLIASVDNFKIDGETRTWSRKGDSGKTVTYTYCGTCPNIVTVNTEALPGIKIIKAGTCDDEDLLRTTEPKQEIYTKNRYPWVEPCRMAEQKEIS